jgi:hypothetical protein
MPDPSREEDQEFEVSLGYKNYQIKPTYIGHMSYELTCMKYLENANLYRKIVIVRGLEKRRIGSEW